MNLISIAILALVQGLAELLPVSSSAHVIVAEKLLGLDPTDPQMTLLLVMLHTGTMFAVIVYFWKSWKGTYFASRDALRRNFLYLAAATAATGVVGLALLEAIKHFAAAESSRFEIEQLFGNSRLMACALAAAGILILVASRAGPAAQGELDLRRSIWIGAVQGLCLPFRGFSRSGATISTGMLLGVARRRAEEFSFALAVILTPAVVGREVLRLYKAQDAARHADASTLLHLAMPSAIGMILSFFAGLAALRWLTRWLEAGRWHFFGAYCLLAALAVLWLG